MNTPYEFMVSVRIITYNHEAYIAQAIDSVLMQQTDFPYEIIIGEDDSSDNTRAIVKAYAERYPDKIRLLLNDRSNVICIDGRPTGRWNFINTLKYAKGKYVALLDGDDYWTDPLKLQKQVNYLEAHPGCSLSTHKVLLVQAENKHEPLVLQPPVIRETYSLNDYLSSECFQTGTIVFRRDTIPEFPEWFYRIPIGDMGLITLVAEHGDLGYIDEMMGVYRMHAAGIWSATSRVRQLQWHIRTCEIINAHLQFKYGDTLRVRMLRYYNELRQIPASSEPRKDDPSVRLDRPAAIIKRWKPDGDLPLSLRNRLLGEAYARLLFDFHNIRAYSQIRSCVGYMLRYDRSWFAYEDVWAVVIEAFFGEKALARWQRYMDKRRPVVSV